MKYFSHTKRVLKWMGQIKYMCLYLSTCLLTPCSTIFLHVWKNAEHFFLWYETIDICVVFHLSTLWLFAFMFVIVSLSFSFHYHYKYLMKALQLNFYPLSFYHFRFLYGKGSFVRLIHSYLFGLIITQKSCKICWPMHNIKMI